MPAFDMLTFDRNSLAQVNYLRDTFRKSLKPAWPWVVMKPEYLLADLDRQLKKPGTFTDVLTPKGQPDDFLGWVSVRPGERSIVYGYVKHSVRRMGVMTSALLEHGIDFLDGPVGLVYWTPAAARLAARRNGPWRLYHDTRSGYDDASHFLSQT